MTKASNLSPIVFEKFYNIAHDSLFQLHDKIGKLFVIKTDVISMKNMTNPGYILMEVQLQVTCLSIFQNNFSLLFLVHYFLFFKVFKEESQGVVVMAELHPVAWHQ